MILFTSQRLCRDFEDTDDDDSDGNIMVVGGGCDD